MTRESNRKTLLQLKDFVEFGQVHHVECDPPDWFPWSSSRTRREGTADSLGQRYEESKKKQNKKRL